MAEAIVSTASAAAGADRKQLPKADLETAIAGLRGELYRTLWIQAAALIGAQIAIAGFIVHLLGQ